MINIIKFMEPSKKINFIAQSKYAFIVSLILIVATFFSLTFKGLNYGIDFQGGILIEIESPEVIDMSDMRSQISKMNLDEVNLQSLGTSGTEMMVHVLVDTADEKAQNEIVNQLKETLGENVDYRRIEVVGPKVGAELFKKSIIASICALLAISVYIWFRFEWQFSLACLIALAHDLILI